MLRAIRAYRAARSDGVGTLDRYARFTTQRSGMDEETASAAREQDEADDESERLLDRSVSGPNP